MDVTQQVSEVDATLLGAAVQSAIEQSSTLVEHLQQFVDAALNRVDDLCAKARSEETSAKRA
jgi:ribosome assembly protein YihI (activator of Der GTPase)